MTSDRPAHDETEGAVILGAVEEREASPRRALTAHEMEEFEALFDRWRYSGLNIEVLAEGGVPDLRSFALGVLAWKATSTPSPRDH
jgi:hypothetical protein